MLVPEGRHGVHDDIARVPVIGYNFQELRHYEHTGVVHLDWDIAIEPVMLEAFIQRAEREPRKIRCIPYRLYPATTNEDKPVWTYERWIMSFGVVYLPPWVLLEWTPVSDEEKFNDTTCGMWLTQQHGDDAMEHVVYDHDLYVVHLHYT